MYAGTLRFTISHQFSPFPKVNTYVFAPALEALRGNKSQQLNFEVYNLTVDPPQKATVNKSRQKLNC
jgi:hypothetical protein